MFRKFLLGCVAFVALSALVPAEACAGYTVYIYNLRRNDGWMRTGFSHDLNTTWASCKSSIQSRVRENQRYRTDFEAYAIVYSPSTPPWGRLTSLPRGWNIWLVYIPVNRWYAQVDVLDGLRPGAGVLPARETGPVLERARLA